MKYSDEYRDSELVQELARRIGRYAGVEAKIMEVCGTHTMSAARFGLSSLLPDTIQLISGPGCPVCVTDQRDIDAFLAIGQVPNVILASFGDMLRVPGSGSSLERLRAEGVDVRVVYSPVDAVDIARGKPDHEIVFFGVGFETTMPATAATVRVAYEEGIKNFFVYCCHKTMPRALRALLSMGQVEISGLLLPGHVTTIIGARAYDFIPQEFGVACAVAGFEPVDMLLGIESILEQITQCAPRVCNSYSRAVRNNPNEAAMEMISDVFVECDSVWRGIGTIAGSGMGISDKYAQLDAKRRFADIIGSVKSSVDSGCKCGEVLRGVIRPAECSFFGKKCTPVSPIGPCMVSSEGACAAAYRYGGVG
ncbi:MAG: hydrogenase formation protein HypD [Armatimonadota bacterium]